MRFRLLLLVLASVFGLSFAGISACGDIGAGVHTLDGDLSGYDGLAEHCLRILSSDVVLDCQGHSITGTGGYQGIYINQTSANITIRNCVVRDYANGIFIDAYSGLSGSLITDCNFTGNEVYDISISDLSNSTITRVRGNTGLHLNEYVMGLYQSSITDNIIEEGGTSICKGIHIIAKGGGYNVIEGNTVRNTSGGNCFEISSPNNLIANNSALGCHSGNNGFYINGPFNSIIGNLAEDSAHSGFYVQGKGNRIENNTARRNAQGDINRAGFELMTGKPPVELMGVIIEDGYNMNVSGNLAENNRGNGFYLGPELAKGRIFFHDNAALRNLVGISVQSRENRLENNTAQENVVADLFVGGEDIWEGGPFGIFMTTFDPEVCDNTIVNTTGSGGRPIFYANSTATVPAGTYSGIILCNAPGSAMNGVTVDGSANLSNNGAILLWSPGTTITNSLSRGNMIGFWLYGSPNTAITGGSASRNFAAGYILAGSENSTLSGLQSSNNYGSLADLIGAIYPEAEIPPMLLNAIPFGFGIVEMPISSEPLPQGTTYTSVRVNGNAYGMVLFVFSEGARVMNSDIHDNRIFGIVDATQNEVLVNTSNSRIFGNGDDFMDLMALLNPGFETFQQYIFLKTLQHGPEGVFQTEYFQASYVAPYILGIFFGGFGGQSTFFEAGEGELFTKGSELSAQWHLVQDKMGFSDAGMTISVDDMLDSDSHLLGDTTLPSITRLQFDEYLGIFEFPLFQGCTTTCNAPRDCYDFMGEPCKDTNLDGICDYYQTEFADCRDVDENGWCDECDTFSADIRFNWTEPEGLSSYKGQYLGVISMGEGRTSALDNFTAWWSPSECFDGETMALYQLEITGFEYDENMSEPGPGDTISVNVSGEWVLVERQTPGQGRVDVAGLEPYIPVMLVPAVETNRMGIYGLFAAPLECGGDDDGGQEIPGEPEENQTAPECTDDGQCAVNERCVQGSCERFPCECGEYRNHECVEYDCCSDSECAAGEYCYAHKCWEEEPEYECTSDSMCAGSEYCDIPAGAAGGSCEPVEAKPCGEIRDHAFVPYGYECGDEEGCPSCPSGEACLKHECVQADVSCPSTGMVGDSKTCEAREEGEICPACDYEVTSPDGRKFYGKTDENGNFELPLELKGTYQVTLLKEGQPVRTIQVQAFPQAEPEEPEKPTAGGPDAGMLLWAAVLVLAAAAFLVYWRSRGKKRK